ncbi:MAG: sugar kinase [Gemmatimonadetes bacterium]|nr:MAG: sugar kinase [Gemmatimonadota bacterium]
MSIVVVGSVALDSVETPFGKAENALGGSATYFSAAASYFSPVNIVAVVGDDFPQEDIEFLRERGVNMEGLEVIKGGKTFHWKGYYGYNLNEAQTLDTQLNVFETFNPQLPESYRNSDYLFLANIHPALQLSVLEQVESPKLIAVDSMNLWISETRNELLTVLGKVDIAMLNDGEARQLSGEANLIKAAKAVREMGPKVVIIKKGEHGVAMFGEDSYFVLPASPVEEVKDPTGAGDSFAGGFMGYIAKAGNLEDRTLRRAVVYGSTIASFCVEDFSLERYRTLTMEEIEARYETFKEFSAFA